MRFDDTLVAVVAAGLGIATLLAGALNWETAYQFRPARWVEAKYGRTAARVFYAVLGLLLIGMGIAISQGWVLNRPSGGI